MYASCIQSFYLNVDTSTTRQITTAPTMKQADEVLSPIRTAIARSRGPLFKFLTEGSLQNTTGSKANRMKLASTKKGIENFLTNSIVEILPMSTCVILICADFVTFSLSSSGWQMDVSAFWTEGRHTEGTYESWLSDKQKPAFREFLVWVDVCVHVSMYVPVHRLNIPLVYI